MFNRSSHPQARFSRLRGGWTLVEMMITGAISTVVMASMMTVMLFATKDFMAIGNYGELNQSSRYALDVMNRDIRQATRLTAGNAYNITMTNDDGDRFSYDYDPDATTLTRRFTNYSGSIVTRVLLTNCDAFAFNFYLRVPTNHPPTGFYGPAFIAAGNNNTDTKLINVDWKCSRMIQGTKANTENVQTAQIAIRN